MKKKKVCASEIVLWALCPRAYYFQRIQKMPTLLNKNMLHGILVHQIYKSYFESQNIEELIKIKIPELIKTNSPHLRLLKIDKKELKKELTELAIKLDFRTKYGFSSIPKYIERTFETEKIIARVDCVFTNENPAVGDIKLNGNIDLGTKLQITAGAIAVEQTLRISIEKGVIIDGKEWNEYFIKITPDLRKLVNDIVETILDFNSNPYLPQANFNPYKCNCCSFKHLCRVKSGDNNVRTSN